MELTFFLEIFGIADGRVAGERRAPGSSNRIQDDILESSWADLRVFTEGLLRGQLNGEWQGRLDGSLSVDWDCLSSRRSLDHRPKVSLCPTQIHQSYASHTPSFRWIPPVSSPEPCRIA